MLTLLIIFAYSASTVVNADLVVKPWDTEAVIGDSTYFDCTSNVNRNEVHWYYYTVGAKEHEDICLYCLRRIHPQYKSRIEVERNASTGNSRLMINSVQRQDAGRYICQDNGGIGESASAELVILESSPTCTSNMKPDGVLGPNSCGLEPDTLHLSCQVSYYGNIPPPIKWRQAKTQDHINPLSCQNTGNQITCNLTMTADLGLNGVSYICETSSLAGTQYNCVSNIIRVVYVLPNNPANQMVLGAEKKVICSVNSSQSCIHTWKWFDGVQEEIVAKGAVLVTQKPGWYQCDSDCNIRGKQCAVLSKVVHVSKPQSPLTSVAIGVICLLIIAVGSFTIGLVFSCLRHRNKAKYRHHVCTTQGKPLLNDESERPIDVKDISNIALVAATTAAKEQVKLKRGKTIP